MATRARAPLVGTVFRVVFAGAAALFILYGVYRARHVLVLVLVAGFLAVGLDPPVRRLQSLGLKRGQAVAAIFLAALLVIVGFFAAVVPPLVDQVANFAQNLPRYIDDLAENNPRIQEFVSERNLSDRLRDATTKLPSSIAGSFGSALGIAGSILASVFNTLTVLVLTVYFALSLAKIREGSLRYIPKSKRRRVQELMEPILLKIGSYIAGNIAVSLIAGVVAFAFLAIVGVPFPVALALWVAIADLIPLVGASLGAVPAVLVAFFDSVPIGIATLVYFVIYQQVENYVIVPRVMNRAVDLSAAAVLLAALIGGSLLGVVGVLMAIPLAAAIKLLANELILPRAEAS